MPIPQQDMIEFVMKKIEKKKMFASTNQISGKQKQESREESSTVELEWIT